MTIFKTIHFVCHKALICLGKADFVQREVRNSSYYPFQNLSYNLVRNLSYNLIPGICPTVYSGPEFVLQFSSEFVLQIVTVECVTPITIC